MKNENKINFPYYLPETGLWYVYTTAGEWEIFKTQSAAENFCEEAAEKTIQQNERPLTYVLHCNGAEIYLPALAGDLPHGADMARAAEAYVKDMKEDGGDQLIAVHVSIWAEFAAALSIAAAKAAGK